MILTTSCRKSFPLLLLIIFDLLLLPTFGVNSSDIRYEIKPFIRVYENGTVERLSGTDTVPPSPDPNSGVLSKDILIEPTLNISARLFKPKSAAENLKLPLFVYFHGGAFFTESPFSPTYHNYIASVVDNAEVMAVSVNYRLAPEHPLPIAYEDSWVALKWVFSHAKEKGGKGEESWLRNNVDFEHVCLGGDSAGGNIAHNTAVRAGVEGVKIRCMFLNCPHFWGKTRIGKEASRPEEVDSEEKEWIHAYPNSTGFDDPKLNPSFDPNLSRLGCRKVLVYVAENDILRDRGLNYEKALDSSKWKGVAKTVEVKGQFHVFNLNSPNITEAKRMMRHLSLFLNDKDKLH